MSSAEVKMTVGIGKLFLATDNPRHEEVDDETGAIERLCAREDIDALARDISRHGVNPAERLIVFPVEPGLAAADINNKTTFIVAEGNRRVCAVKLLHDPDKAPAKIRGTIEKSSDRWTPVDELDAVVILDEERRRHWLRRIHDGVQGGVGRKPWSSEQKTRFSGTRRNLVAQALLDYGAKNGLIQEADRKGSFSHMARLVGNVLVADTLGLDLSNGPEDILRNRPKGEFDIILGEVLKEAVKKKLGSQAKKGKIDGFAHDLQSLAGVTSERITPEPLEDLNGGESGGGSAGTAGSGGAGGAGGAGGSTGHPTPPKKPVAVRQEKEIYEALQEIDSEKLQSLYYSICFVSAKLHAPLVAVGVWSFFESLCASIGKTENTPFKDFLSRGKMSSMGIGKGKELNAPAEALGQIAAYGNLTKHHKVAAHFDYMQIINNMKVLTPVILACIEEIKSDE